VPVACHQTPAVGRQVQAGAHQPLVVPPRHPQGRQRAVADVERLDWPLLRKETDDNDFAVAFLVLAERLGLTG